jgi:hypothetical protein
MEQYWTTTLAPSSFLFYFTIHYHLLYWFLPIRSLFYSSIYFLSLLSLPFTPLQCPVYPSSACTIFTTPWHQATTSPSYYFVVDYTFINQILSYFPHFAHVSVPLCLTVTQGRIPSIMDRLCPATLNTTLPTIHPLATTLLADTKLMRHFTAHTLPYVTPY